MLLRALREYATRLDLPPKLYAEGPVRYIVELDGDGNVLNRELTDTADPSNPRTRRGQRRLLPQVQRSSAVRPLLLADKADYVLGIAEDPGRQERARNCHEAFVTLVRNCYQETGEPAVKAVLRFLERGPVGQLELPDDFDHGGIITFRVAGAFPIDLPAVQAFWARWNDPEAAGAPQMQCVVCGQHRPVTERLQAKVKGVPGGQTSGTSIVSANADAFESYGLRASLIAPTCADCGERFTKSLNELLSSERHAIRIGSTAFVFWTREEVEFDFRSALTDPQPEMARALIEAFETGRKPGDMDDTDFYALALSGSGGRAVVRDWIDTTVGHAKAHLGRWLAHQRVVGPAGEEPRPAGIHALALATVRDGNELAPPVPRALLRAALLGGPLPESLLAQAVKRNRAERAVTRTRAALIKLVLTRSQSSDQKEDALVQLDPNHPDPAYHCGRLLAVLEQAQRAAIPGIKATIVDRFFGMASTAPAAVFSRLVRGAQPHLGKLERDRPGTYRALQNRLEEIQSAIPASGYPRTLTLHQQGLFALGYYHQRAYDRAQARAAVQRGERDLAALAEAEIQTEEELNS